MLEDFRMKNIVKYLIIVLCLLIICVIILLKSYNTKNNENIDNTNNVEKSDEFEIKADNNLTGVSFNNEIMNIKECIQNYIENRNLHV